MSDKVIPLNNQIKELERITISSKAEQQVKVMQAEYVSKLAEFKSKYQSADNSPKQ
jgi:hypothetical protein